MTEVDVLIVGGGPAGLTAAIYLERFRRSILLVDDGNSRAAWIPKTHNYPGFAAGISGDALLARLRAQVEENDGRITKGRVTALAKDGEGFIATLGEERVRARMVLLATGMEDEHPEIERLEDAVQAGLLRYCPICDAYDVRGRKLAILGKAASSVGHARFLRTFTTDLTVVIPADSGATAEDHAAYREIGVTLIDDPVASLAMEETKVRVDTAGGQVLRFDSLYPMLGCRNHSELAKALGAKCSKAGDLICDEYLQTSVPGLFAAGDVVNALNQVAVATGHAAVAATHIHNALPKNPMR